MEEGECVGGGGKGWRKESVKMEDGEGGGGKGWRKERVEERWW